MFYTQFIPLQVVIPLLLSPLCMGLNKPRIAWFITLIATWSSFFIAISIVSKVGFSGETLSYAMGGWVAPIGIEYRINSFNSLILLLVTGIAAILMPFAYHTVKNEIAENKQALFYTVFLLCFAGLLGITITNDAFNIYVFLEISSLATYTLIAMGKKRKALSAAFEYLILGSIGATFYLIGIGLLFMVTGTLNFTDLASLITVAEHKTPIITGFAFITVGLLLKIALFPLHSWLCQAYSYAPSIISAFLAATATKVSIYVLIRIIYEMFGTNFHFSEIVSIEGLIKLSLYPLSLIAILAGSFSAIYQNNIKKSLAYSSIAQIGYITLGISLMSELGLTASITHIFNHGLAKAGLFAVCGAVLLRFHGITLEHFKGMGKEMPITMAGFIILGLSMIGVPFTAGFISKWILIQAVIEKKMWLAIIVILIGSVMAIVYIWRIIEQAYFSEHPNAVTAKNTEAPLMVLLSIWTLAIASIYFGLDTTYSKSIASEAAKFLLGGNG